MELIMGRKLKYKTPEEKKEANNQKVKVFYWKNKRRLDLEANIRYWKKKLTPDTELPEELLNKINEKISKFQRKLDMINKPKEPK